MKRLLWALWGTLFLSAGTMADIPAGYKLILQTENYPPFNFTVNGSNFAKEDGVDGISVRIVQEMFKRSSIDYSMVLRFSWSRIYNKAKDKEGYGVFSMVRNEQREPLFKWIGPLAPIEWVFFVRQDSDIQLSSLQDAKQYKIGGYKGDALTNYLLSEGLEVQESAADHLNAKKLQSGKIDLWAANNLSGRYFANQQGVAGMKEVLALDKVNFYLGVNKETPNEVVTALQDALDSMRKDGSLDKIVNEYLG